MSELTDVLDRLKRAPLGALVSELRDLHELQTRAVGRVAGAAGSVLSPSGPGAAHPSRVTGTAPDADLAARPATMPVPQALAPVLGLLQRASRAAGASSPTTLSGSTVPILDPSPAAPRKHDEPRDVQLPRSDDQHYAFLQHHFGEHERDLRRHAQLTDRILSQLGRGEAVTTLPETAPLQQEVRLLCAAGGTSGGRFLLRNELERPALVELRIHPPRGSDGRHDAPRVACTPHRLDLDAGNERLVRIAVDLSACSARAGDEIELVVDALVDDEVVQKVWVSVGVHDAVPEDAR